jgi:hypothetical protein
MPVIPEFGVPNQDDQEFEASSDNIVSMRLPWTR